MSRFIVALPIILTVVLAYVAALGLIALALGVRSRACAKRGHGKLREVDSGIQCTTCGTILDD